MIDGSVMEQRAPMAVDWRGIASIPEDRKDGRDVLLWIGACAMVGSWCDGWRDPVGRLLRAVTHWADVEGPVA